MTHEIPDKEKIIFRLSKSSLRITVVGGVMAHQA